MKICHRMTFQITFLSLAMVIDGSVFGKHYNQNQVRVASERRQGNRMELMDKYYCNRQLKRRPKIIRPSASDFAYSRHKRFWNVPRASNSFRALQGGPEDHWNNEREHGLNENDQEVTIEWIPSPLEQSKSDDFDPPQSKQEPTESEPPVKFQIPFQYQAHPSQYQIPPYHYQIPPIQIGPGESIPDMLKPIKGSICSSKSPPGQFQPFQAEPVKKISPGKENSEKKVKPPKADSEKNVKIVKSDIDKRIKPVKGDSDKKVKAVKEDTQKKTKTAKENSEKKVKVAKEIVKKIT